MIPNSVPSPLYENSSTNCDKELQNNANFAKISIIFLDCTFSLWAFSFWKVFIWKKKTHSWNHVCHDKMLSIKSLLFWWYISLVQQKYFGSSFHLRILNIFRNTNMLLNNVYNVNRKYGIKRREVSLETYSIIWKSLLTA